MHIRDRALLAAAAAVMIASAAPAAPQDSERSYLPPQSPRPQEAAKGEQAAPQDGRRLEQKARVRRHRRHAGREYEAGPPYAPFFADMFFFPFF